MGTEKVNEFTPYICVAIIGAVIGWLCHSTYSNEYGDAVESRSAVAKLSRELDSTNSQLTAIIDEQVKACKTRGLNVFITNPFPVQAESIGIETAITIKIKYLNWQIELVIALSRMLNTSNPTPKPRPGSIGSVGSSYGASFDEDVLPKGVVIR
jgi:hypothetical protein